MKGRGGEGDQDSFTYAQKQGSSRTVSRENLEHNQSKSQPTTVTKSNELHVALSRANGRSVADEPAG